MAIVETIPDDPPLRQRTSTRNTKNNKNKNRGKMTIPVPPGVTITEIPLSHPSSARARKTDADDLPRRPLVNLHDSDFDSGSGSDEDEHAKAEEGDESELIKSARAAVGRQGGEGEGEGVGDDEIFTTLIYAVPFTFLYLLLDILVHLQYAHRPGLGLLAKHVATALPTLSMIVLYSNRHPSHLLTNPLLMASSIMSGTRLIWLVNKASWSVVTAQAPAVGTLWIVSIVQLPLSRALIALVFVGGWCWYSGLKWMP